MQTHLRVLVHFTFKQQKQLVNKFLSDNMIWTWQFQSLNFHFLIIVFNVVSLYSHSNHILTPQLSQSLRQSVFSLLSYSQLTAVPITPSVCILTPITFSPHSCPNHSVSLYSHPNHILTTQLSHTLRLNCHFLIIVFNVVNLCSHPTALTHPPTVPVAVQSPFLILWRTVTSGYVLLTKMNTIKCHTAF
jgi:hypothetical protein